MPNTYVALTPTITLSSNTTTVTISSIPQGYTDLRVVIVPASSSGTNGVRMRINSDSNSNYSATYLSGTGSSALSARESNVANMSINYYSGITTTLGTIMYTLDFQNYSNSTTQKTVLGRTNSASQATESFVGLYRSTSAITSLSFNINTFGSSTGDFVAGSTFSLYGIANADQGSAKATGGIITEDSQYWYHTFGASGAFIPKQALTCDVLVVAGGGAGGANTGGGGGAGGLCYQTGRSVSATTYNITVGAGGTAGAGAGGSGTNSVFDTITALGGGGGNYGPFAAGSSGGSGGGGGEGQAGGSATQGNSGGATGYGNAGATGPNSAPYRHGGGGGAGTAGVSGSSTGAGGDGLSTWSSWGVVTGIGENVSGTYYLAGGGGGGSNSTTASPGGLGGGGIGSGTTNSAGLANTGGGGGGAGSNAGTSRAGGSGVVIVRYAK